MLSGKWSRFQKKYQLLIKKNDSCESKPKLHVLFAMWPPPNSTFFAEKIVERIDYVFLELISHLTVVYCKLRSWKTSALESLGFLFDMQLSVMCLIMKHGQQTFLFLSFVPSRSLFFPPFVIKIKKKKIKNHHVTIVGEISRLKQLNQNFETYLGKPCESLESLLNSVY